MYAAFSPDAFALAIAYGSAAAAAGGNVVFAYGVTTVVTAIANADQVTRTFENTLDNLNAYCAAMRIPEAQRVDTWQLGPRPRRTSYGADRIAGCPRDLEGAAALLRRALL